MSNEQAAAAELNFVHQKMTEAPDHVVVRGRPPLWLGGSNFVVLTAQVSLCNIRGGVWLLADPRTH